MFKFTILCFFHFVELFYLSCYVDLASRTVESKKYPLKLFYLLNNVYIFISPQFLNDTARLPTGIITITPWKRKYIYQPYFYVTLMLFSEVITRG